MATAVDSAGSSDVPDPRRCDSAEEYVRHRLADADEPLSPAELAADYGCGAKHMRNVLSEMAQGGDVDRVSRGQYELGSAEPDADDLPTPDLDDLDVDDAAEVNGSEQGSSEGSDGRERTESEMATTDEYRRQHADSDDGGTDPSGSDRMGDDDGTAEVNGPDRTSSEDDAAEVNGRDRSDTEGDVDRPAVPVGDPTTVLMLVTVGVLLYLGYRTVTGSSASTSAEQGGQDAADDAAQMDGGLVQDG